MKDLTLLDYLKVIKQHYRVVGLTILGTLLLTPMICWLLPKKYEVATTFLPTSNSSSPLTQMLSNAQKVPVFGNLASSFANDNNAKLWHVVNSRSVGMKVVQTLELDKIFFSQNWDRQKSQWKNPEEIPSPEQVATYMIDNGIVSFEQDDKGLFKIIVRTDDPKLAQQIAEKYISATQEFINESTLSLAKKNRIFLEQQLTNTSEQLKEIEERLRIFHQEHGLIALDAQTELTINTQADLEAKIISIDTEIALLGKQIGVHNPEVRRLIDRKQELNKQLSQMGFSRKTVIGNIAQQNKRPSAANRDSLLLNPASIPNLTMEYLDLKRVAMIKETVYTLLNEQYELARIEEIKEDVGFQVIDPPLTPKDYVFPKPLLFTIIAVFLALVISIMSIFSLEYFTKTEAMLKLKRVG